MKLKALFVLAVFLLTTQVTAAASEKYQIDTKGAHAFIQFKVSHLGYSYIYGRFNTFSGSFSIDAKEALKSAIELEIDTTSVDTNHAKRDDHIRGGDFLDVEKYPKASFVSTEVKIGKDGKGSVTGDLTLHGVTKPITIAIKKVGEGKDPWGGYRKGFEGTTSISPADFGIISKFLAPKIEFDLVLEGIRQ